MGAVDILVAVLAVGYILFRRTRWSVLAAKPALILPIVLTVIGLQGLGDDLSSMNATGTVLVVGGIVLSALIGLVRGATVHVAQFDSILWVRYRAVTVGLWILNIAVKVGLAVLIGLVGGAHSGTTGLMASLGLGLFTESLVVLYRAWRTGVPVLWSRRDQRPGNANSAASPLMNATRW